MDTSPEYILQCEKAKEITTNHKYEDGDVFIWFDNIHQDTIVHNWWIDKGTIDFYREGVWESSEFITSANVIWLPRQDQMQEMIDFRAYDMRFFENHLWITTGENGQGIGYTANSMEQLWLSFVMKEKWGKIWSGTDWVKEK